MLTPLRPDILCGTAAVDSSGAGARNGAGETALGAAVRGGHLEVARALLRAGADPNLGGGVTDGNDLGTINVIIEDFICLI